MLINEKIEHSKKINNYFFKFISEFSGMLAFKQKMQIRYKFKKKNFECCTFVITS